MLYQSSSGLIELQITKAQAAAIYVPGRDCTPEVEALVKVPAIARQLKKLKPEVIADELREYGAWTAEELADHNENILRLLWLASLEILETVREKQNG
jgi:hypothetical protein